VHGPRLPDVDHSQKKFNTGMVVVVEHGKTPSAELMERTNGIRLRWMDYWETTTGHRSSMTTNPKEMSGRVVFRPQGEPGFNRSPDSGVGC
jgi:hypothetical protein